MDVEVPPMHHPPINHGIYAPKTEVFERIKADFRGGVHCHIFDDIPSF